MRPGKCRDEVVGWVRNRPGNRRVSDGRNREEEGCCESSPASFPTNGHYEIPLFSSFSGPVLTNEAGRWCDGTNAIHYHAAQRKGDSARQTLFRDVDILSGQVSRAAASRRAGHVAVEPSSTILIDGREEERAVITAENSCDARRRLHCCSHSAACCPGLSFRDRRYAAEKAEHSVHRGR